MTRRALLLLALVILALVAPLALAAQTFSAYLPLAFLLLTVAPLALAALGLPVPMVSILVYYSYPDWQATGIRTTPLEAQLMGTGYPAPGQ